MTRTIRDRREEYPDSKASRSGVDGVEKSARREQGRTKKSRRKRRFLTLHDRYQRLHFSSSLRTPDPQLTDDIPLSYDPRRLFSLPIRLLRRLHLVPL